MAGPVVRGYLYLLADTWYYLALFLELDYLDNLILVIERQNHVDQI